MVRPYKTLSTEVWSVRIPSQWEEKKSSTDGLYFESPDGGKGLYISTWSFAPETHGHSNSIAAEHVQSAQKRLLHKMKGYTWRLMAEEQFSRDGIEQSMMDYYAKEKSYRIACEVIASLPWVISCNFHHYDCQDWDASREEFQEILFSIEMHK